MKKNLLNIVLLLFWPLLVCGQNNTLLKSVQQADSLRKQFKYEIALDVLFDVALDAQKSNDYEIQARAAMSIAAVYVETKKIKLAIDKYHEAIRYSKLWGNPLFENRSIYGIGMAHSNAGNYDSALYYLALTEATFIKNKDFSMLAGVATIKASNHADKGDYKTAITENKKAARLYEQVGALREEANRYWYIANDYFKANLLDSAEYFFRKSFKKGDSLKLDETKAWARQGLGQVLAKRRDFEEAYKSMKEGFDVAVGLFSSEYDSLLLDMSEKYNSASFELEAEKQKNLKLEQVRIKNIVLITGLALLVIISIWLYVVDQRRKNIKSIATKNDQINKQKIDELLQQQEIASLQGVLEGQETERKRVAIDLHDRLGGILSMVKLHFSSVEEKIDPDNPSKEKFLTASELLDLAAGEVRNISHNMMSGVLAKFGLIPALEDLQTRISETGKLKVNLYTSNITGALDGEQELQLYRIVQELMSNILKHSEATETNIQLNENEDSVNLIMEDDGVGFNPQKLDVNAGIGLSNLKARVAKLNGTLHIDSGLGSGTTVSIDIPIEND